MTPVNPNNSNKILYFSDDDSSNSNAGDISDDANTFGDFPDADEIRSYKGKIRDDASRVKITYPEGFIFGYDPVTNRAGYLSPTLITKVKDRVKDIIEEIKEEDKLRLNNAAKM